MKKFKLIALIVLVAMLIVGTTVVLAQENDPPGFTREEMYELAELGNSQAGEAGTDTYVKGGTPDEQMLMEEQQRPVFEWAEESGLTQDADPNDPSLAGWSGTALESEKEGGSAFSTSGTDTENVINGKP